MIISGVWKLCNVRVLCWWWVCSVCCDWNCVIWNGLCWVLLMMVLNCFSVCWSRCWNCLMMLLLGCCSGMLSWIVLWWWISMGVC